MSDQTESNEAESSHELQEDLRYELDQMDQVVRELESLEEDVSGRSPTLREQAAASSFLASFYTGVENILKRILRDHDREVPRSERWHVELFEQFTPVGRQSDGAESGGAESGGAEPSGVDPGGAESKASWEGKGPEDELPVLFPGDLIDEMDAYRRFRHIAHHGYERDLDYERMQAGIEGARSVFEKFRSRVIEYLNDRSPG
jgi:hypothetical protein